MIVSQVTTRGVGLAALISSLLLGTVAAQADRHLDPSLTRHAQDLSPMEDNRPARNAPSPDADTAADTQRTEVGDEASNVDEDASSGSYYPYSAGTVGDDPAEPTSTSVSTVASDSDAGPTDQGDDASDSDGDNKLTRGEFRSWHESRKARVKANEEATSTTDGSTPGRTTPPDDHGN